MSGPTKAEWKERAEVAEAEVERLRMMLDPEVSFRDMEMAMRDGKINLRLVLGEGSRPATKFLAALMMHAILGDEDGEPPTEPDNYRSTYFEWDLTPAMEFRPLRCSIEVIKQGGKSSHEIRRELEAELAQYRDGAA